MIAKLMFGPAPIQPSNRQRYEAGQWLGETVATFGLVLGVYACTRNGKGRWVPVAAVACIVSACWFTSSTSFADPAVTLARTLSNPFSAISPASILPFLLGEVLGALAAVGVARMLTPGEGGGRA